MRKYEVMTSEEIRIRIRELSDILDYGCCDERWDAAYAEYTDLRAEQDERYRKANQADFDAFYARHIEGKSWENINPDAWQCYSDWHKDMYGFRPRIV